MAGTPTASATTGSFHRFTSAPASTTSSPRRCIGNDTNQLPFRLFWWESPDGSKVLTLFPTDYVHTDLNPGRISADFAESAQRNPGTTEHLDLYGIGDHGGGPTRDMLDQGDHWIAEGAKSDTAVPAMRYGTAQHFFDDVQTHLNPNSPTWDYDSIAKGYTAPPTGPNGEVGIPTWKDELYFEYHRGVYTTQAAHKRGIRTTETATLDAEKLASFAWLDGDAYPGHLLNTNWQKITFNEFHDLAAGSGIAVIYRDAQDDFHQVLSDDQTIDAAALKTLNARIDTTSKTGVPVIVYNTLAWPRSEVVPVTVQLPDASDSVCLADTHNHCLPTDVLHNDAATHTFDLLARVDDIPALGYTVLHAIPAKAAPQDNAHAALSPHPTPPAFTLTNQHVSITVDRKTGCITHLADGSGTEFFAPNACGNQLQTFTDTPKDYDAWNIDPGTLDGKMTPIDTLDSIKLLSTGPLRHTIRITRTWSKSHFIQDISLDADADFVRVSTTVDWHETHVLLKAAFPLAASGPKATYEIPYGNIERTTTRNNSWEKAQFEVPALRWADLGGTVGNAQQGFSILNDSKYGYDAAGNVLRLTLLRSPIWPDPDADRGTQHFTYELYPHTGSWKDALTVRRGYELNTPLLAQQVFAHTGELPATHSVVSLDAPNVTLSAVKKAEDANALVFRMYEWAGKPTEVKLHIPTGAQYAIETNLMEDPIPNAEHLPLSGDTVTVPIKPYEILTLQVSHPEKRPPAHSRPPSTAPKSRKQRPKSFSPLPAGLSFAFALAFLSVIPLGNLLYAPATTRSEKINGRAPMPAPRGRMTRAAPQTAARAGPLRALGVDPILIPTIELADPTTFAPPRRRPRPPRHLPLAPLHQRQRRGSLPPPPHRHPPHETGCPRSRF